jgi:hypothetical protein
MKNFLSLLAIFLTLHSGAQIIKQGDTLNIEFKKLSKPYFFGAPALTGWIEGANMLFIGSKPNPNDCSFLFITLKDSTLIGVFKRGKPSEFMFDTEGNSVLSDTSDIFLLPLWTVKNRTRIDSTDKAVLNVLERLYETTMQADDGHPDEETLGRYRQFQSDTSLANRHIALLFDNYQTIISETRIAVESGLQPENCLRIQN